MMNEEQLQRIEKGFAAATPLSIYNPHGDRALADIMVDLESRTIVPALIAEVRVLRAKLDAANVEWQEEHAARLVLAEQLKVAEAKAIFWWNEATHPNVEAQP